MSDESEPVRLTWPFEIHCHTEAEAINLHRANRHSTRAGLVVTFRRTHTFRSVPNPPAPPRRTLRPPDDPAFAPFRR